ncbi:putative tricarboxylic transport membrane protein [Bhargavaea beijingensis]|uniref:Putative tricarboxylic transport membrane protein n=1 Tax=Bhargavaea beijingensis TaxID=426756 RepID=A0A1G7FUL6_9BACL|nr:tripartite tricarboxylate transporter TctB family protein [Bhargavaea beijingensis]SDE79623.1 putative tricarboxylic transport membrane protein [Bhargavaea beijingensis]
MLKTLNQKVSLILIAIAALYLFGAFRIPSYPYAIVDADVLPKTLGVLLIVLSIFLFFAKDSETEEQKKRRDIPKREIGMLLGVAGLILAYILLLEVIGFVLTTALFIFFCSFFLGYRNHVANGITAVVFPLVLYFMFTELLSITLPSGILPF